MNFYPLRERERYHTFPAPTENRMANVGPYYFSLANRRLTPHSLSAASTKRPYQGWDGVKPKHDSHDNQSIQFLVIKTRLHRTS